MQLLVFYPEFYFTVFLCFNFRLIVCFVCFIIILLPLVTNFFLAIPIALLQSVAFVIFDKETMLFFFHL